MAGPYTKMDQARPTRKLLDWKPMGKRPIRRPRQRWQEDVTEYLKKLKMRNWKETAKDIRTWRDLAEKAKIHKGLQCQMMMMMTILLYEYDVHNEHFAFGTSCMWFWCAAFNQFANTSALSIRTYTAVSYNTRITYVQ